MSFGEHTRCSFLYVVMNQDEEQRFWFSLCLSNADELQFIAREYPWNYIVNIVNMSGYLSLYFKKSENKL